MFKFLFNFFNKTQDQNLTKGQNKKENFCNIYNEQYRGAYNKLWIKKIRNYYP
jgi:hypothetical protein